MRTSCLHGKVREPGYVRRLTRRFSWRLTKKSITMINLLKVICEILTAWHPPSRKCLRENDVIWCVFLQGKQVELSRFALAFTLRALCARLVVKSSDQGQVEYFSTKSKKKATIWKILFTNHLSFSFTLHCSFLTARENFTLTFLAISCDRSRAN